VLYVLNAVGPNVWLGMCSVDAHDRLVVEMGFWFGGVSMPYEIHKCHMGSM